VNIVWLGPAFAIGAPSTENFTVAAEEFDVGSIFSWVPLEHLTVEAFEDQFQIRVQMSLKMFAKL
jgi:hypothetical protein